MAPPLLVIKIVKYCGIWGRGGGGGQWGAPNSYKRLWAPFLCHYKIAKYCGVGGGEEGIAGREHPTKDNGAPSFCHYKIVRLARAPLEIW